MAWWNLFTSKKPNQTQQEKNLEEVMSIKGEGVEHFIIKLTGKFETTAAVASTEGEEAAIGRTVDMFTKFLVDREVTVTDINVVCEPFVPPGANLGA